jgi:hypothetical protein
MSRDTTPTRIDENGLRYRSKTPGSPFAPAGSFGAGTMSCFLCGQHRPRSLLGTKRILGKAQQVCQPSCKAVREAKDTATAAATTDTPTTTA